jgi:hypothetical protein
MSKNGDRNIESVFKQLREEEEKFTPDFQRVLSAAKSPRRASGWNLWWRPAAVMLLFALIAGPVLYVSFHESGDHELEIPSELGGWESPTDFLLSFNDASLDSSLSEIGTTLWSEEDLTNLEN